MKTEAYGFAIRDATKAIELKPNFVKVRFPRPAPYRCGDLTVPPSLELGILPESDSIRRHIET